jgi:hypothetical protein
VGRLGRRIASLEERFKVPEDAISDEVIKRMSDEELEDYAESLRRLAGRGEPFELEEEDEPIWRRRQELYEEVRDECAAAN